MPCKKCGSNFTLFNWKIKCGECDDKYCTKCLNKRDGVFYCEKCMILLKRPPDPLKLMELKSKDLQEYLNKHNISTYGLVEKQELVELFCNKSVPEKPKRRVTANLAIPNIRPHLNELLENIESVISPDVRQSGTASTTTTNSSNNRTQPNPSRRATPTSPQHGEPPVQSPVRPQRSAPPPPPPPTSSGVFEGDRGGGGEPRATTSGVTEESQEVPNLSHERTPDNNSPLPPPKYPKLTDFGSVEDLTSLSAKQLKQLLTLNRVDFRGCVEKTELLDRAKRLWIDNYEQKKDLPESVQDLCKLCMDAPLDCVLLECGHIATCIDCGKKLNECPICRQFVIRVVRTFKA